MTESVENAGELRVDSSLTVVNPFIPVFTSVDKTQADKAVMVALGQANVNASEKMSSFLQLEREKREEIREIDNDRNDFIPLNRADKRLMERRQSHLFGRGY